MPDNEAPIRLPDPVADPHTYREQLIAMAGGLEPLEVIAATPSRVRALIAGRDSLELKRRPAGGEWPATEIIGHLLDDEIVNAFRLRLTLTGEAPMYPGNEPEAWVNLSKPPIDELLDAWDRLRSYHVWLLQSISASDWNRTGVHAEQGPETVEMQLLKNAGHDLAHVDQLIRCLNR